MIERTPLQPQRELPPEGAPLQQPQLQPERKLPAKEALQLQPQLQRHREPPSQRVEPHTAAAKEESPHIRRLRIYSHSPLFYWWPVWVTGYIMAVLTYAFGDKYLIGQTQTWIHASSNLGLIFFFVLFLVILITNVSVRGLASGMVILGVALSIVLLAYFGWWDHVLSWFGGLEISLNLGAYFWFSTLMLMVWAVSVFVLDRFSYWEIKPGQLTHHALFGSGSKSYNTDGMALDKHRDDLFRHWLIGLGSGDLEIHTAGATRERIDVRNVLFIGSKVTVIQKLIAESPEGEENHH